MLGRRHHVDHGQRRRVHGDDVHGDVGANGTPYRSGVAAKSTPRSGCVERSGRATPSGTPGAPGGLTAAGRRRPVSAPVRSADLDPAARIGGPAITDYVIESLGRWQHVDHGPRRRLHELRRTQ